MDGTEHFDTKPAEETASDEGARDGAAEAKPAEEGATDGGGEKQDASTVLGHQHGAEPSAGQDGDTADDAPEEGADTADEVKHPGDTEPDAAPEEDVVHDDLTDNSVFTGEELLLDVARRLASGELSREEGRTWLDDNYPEVTLSDAEQG